MVGVEHLPARPAGILAALPAAAACRALGGQSFLLGLGPEKSPVLQLPQDTCVLNRRAEPVNQTFGRFAFSGRYVSHAILRGFALLDT